MKNVINMFVIILKKTTEIVDFILEIDSTPDYSLNTKMYAQELSDGYHLYEWEEYAINRLTGFDKLKEKS